MKKYISILWLALLMPAISAQAGQIVTDSIDSKILKSEVKYNVYLPDGYEISSATFPVVYLLHGFTDTYTAWKEKGNMQIVVDELIGTGEACKMVIVMPNAGGPDVYNTWNGYFNMPGWNYEDFFFQEFLPAVESKYHAGGSKHQRAIMGLSMGGGGSVVYSQLHPEMFSSCYAMSPWLDNKFNEVDVEHMPKDRVFYVQESVSKQSALDFVDNADEAALQNLRSVAWFVDCGDDDFLFDQSVAFHQKMRNRGVHSELRVRNGVHNWEYWHLALRWALPFASRNFRN
jgi:S-formylglutathione hydrolase FrmB